LPVFSHEFDNIVGQFVAGLFLLKLGSTSREGIQVRIDEQRFEEKTEKKKDKR